MTTSPKTIVHIDGISKRFGSAVAVDHLDLKIKEGEFVTFLGPSGCGKSTTLRILGGFEKPDTGRIILDGKDVTDLPPNKRNVNMVFQDYALFPHMTVRQNISFGLELKGLTKPKIAARLDELMSFLELTEFADRHPEQLSGGQRQRVALARALALDPALLLLDEPLGALDAKLRSQVQVELKSIQRRTNKTFFFVTHDQDEALTMSDRIVVMNNGLVEQDGTPEDLYFRPTSRFVAGFIGETNLLSGKVYGSDDDTVTFDWFGIKLQGQSTQSESKSGREATASVRLENLDLHRTRPKNGNVVEGRIVNKIFKGSQIAVHLLVEQAQGSTLKAYIAPEVATKLTDDKVWISWDSQRMAILRD
ncbi:MAG: ABC transporter ATP-binding protein [Paracoccaceae bacterium]